MNLSSPRTRGRIAPEAIRAGIAACLVSAPVAIYGSWSWRLDLPRLEGWLPWALLVVTGSVAGLASGRFRDAPVSVGSVVLTSIAVYVATYTLEPWRPTGDPTGSLLVAYLALVLAPVVGAGHLAGVVIRRVPIYGLVHSK